MGTSVRRLRLKQFVQSAQAFHFAATEVPPQHATELHSHLFHEIFWIERGDGIHQINTDRTPLRPGRLVFVSAEDQHCFIGGKHALRICNVAFSRNAWTALRRRYWNSQTDLMTQARIDSREFHVGPACMSQLAETSREFCNGDRTRAALDRFLLNIIAIASTASLAHEAEQPGWLAIACRDIVSREWFSRGVEGFVELAGRSPEHVARAARQYLGRTPTDIVNKARLTWAAARLAESDEPILDIALECGLDNLSHFYHLFRQRFGTTPLRHRHSQQQMIRAD